MTRFPALNRTKPVSPRIVDALATNGLVDHLYGDLILLESTGATAESGDSGRHLGQSFPLRLGSLEVPGPSSFRSNESWCLPLQAQKNG